MMKWRQNLECKLYMREWDKADFVAFNASSGQTHYLNELAVAIFSSLRHNLFNLQDLILWLKENYEDLPSDSDLQVYIESILSSLDDIGLIEPVVFEN